MAPTKRTCSIDGCDFPHAADDLCMTHYRRKKRTGTTDERTYQTDNLCSVDYCTKTACSRGLCAKHYKAWHRHGDPYTIVHIKGQTAATKTCCIIDCDQPQRARGLCNKHYYHGLYQIRHDKLTDHSEYIHNQNLLKSNKQTT